MRSLILAIAFLALPALAQEKPAEPAKDTVALNQKQSDELKDIFQQAELVGEKEKAIRLERENIQMRYALMVCRFMDDLKLSAAEWQFDEGQRVFRKKKEEVKK